MGYVNLSARDNDRLEETTNREAFRETPAYRNFMRLLAAWLSYGSRVQEVVRRGYLDYRRSLMEKGAELPPSMAPFEVVKRIRDQAQKVELSANSLERAQRRVSELEGVSARLGQRAAEAEERIFAEPEETRALSEAADEIQKLRLQLSEVLSVALAELSEFRRQRAMLDVLADQIESQEEQLREVWEAIALGLVAETLSHEVLNLAQRLRGRSAQILTYLSQLDPPDRRVWSFAEDTRSIASGLAKQVSRLDPSLRYVRDKRDRFSMGEFVQDLAEYYAERWDGQLVEVHAKTLKDFSVVMNRGRLQQVLDNLVLNSNYWIRREIRQQRLDHGLIEIIVDDPIVTIVDNGPGIDPAVEHLLFDPFITTKTAHEGRGLGLFIARQLLDADSASIELASARNSRNRLTTFALDFSRTQG